ncbi:hypothetical protein BKI52_23285 [marine bacterium AO1-C]|nr:hypothetical protein BKI52_23285 [marine bacterium AO1-C]
MSKILILDDERQVIQQVSTLLETFGYDYDFIPKADFLFRKLDSDHFDLILLDINMAGRDGVSLLRELKSTEAYHDIEVIMMTGETDDRVLSECFELGAADYITKPIKELVLRARVKAVIDKQMYIREISKQQRLLAEQKAIVDEKNKNITDSIKYAKRIQEAILPDQAVLQNILPEHFILFKPRDIVSGDFYWFHQIDHRVVLAAVDCTGHGIPGAFMSMIGNICLKNIIKENPGIQANEVLNELHIQIRTLLKQDQTDNRDGMDMALVIIDQDQKKMEFSGAKNPLLYFQNGYVTKIKGDKTPIGSNWKRNQHERNFTNHVISLETPTTIYLYSDGYQDQFGGEHNEKFMSRQLIELLTEVHQKPFAEQAHIMDNTLAQWMVMGNEPQLDDILIIGAKIVL